MLSKTANFAAFQLTWWASVLGAADSQDWIDLSVAAGALLLNLYLAADRMAELRAISLVGGLGYLADSALGITGVLEFHGSPLDSRWFAPLWLLGLWLVFATTLASSLSWLSSRPFVAAVLGALCAPLSYAAGHHLGALRVGAPQLHSLLIAAVVWSLFLPLAFRLDRSLCSSGAVFRVPTV